LRGYDINYPVPNFGMDREIKDSLSNVPVAEKIVGDHLSDMTSPEFKEKWENPAKKVDYNFAPELDGNIRDSVKNLADSEKKLNHRYNLGLVQLDSDPICSSGGCDQYKHGHEARRGYDINYPVPNFGMDRDIKDSLSNVPVAEKIVGDKLSDMTSPEFKEKWENPAKKVDYNFAPELDGNIRDSVKNLSDSEKKLNHRYSLSLV
jgi:tRNA A22 N-methylase